MTTSKATRAAIRASSESTRSLARRLGLNPKTVAKWKARESIEDRRSGPAGGRSTRLSPLDEQAIVAFARATPLPLDKSLQAMRVGMPHLTRSTLYNCLRRNGLMPTRTPVLRTSMATAGKAHQPIAPPRNPPPDRRRRATAQTREAILEAAMQLFLRYGYERTSMTAIWEQVGGSKSTFWKHFESKDLLFAEIVKLAVLDFSDQMPWLLDTSIPVKQAIEQFGRKFLSSILSPDRMRIYRLIVGASGHFDEVGTRAIKQVVEMGDRQLAAFIEAHMGLGNLRQDDPHRAAKTLFFLLEGPFSRALIQLETFDDIKIAKEAAAAARTFMAVYSREDHAAVY